MNLCYPHLELRGSDLIDERFEPEPVDKVRGDSQGRVSASYHFNQGCEILPFPEVTAGCFLAGFFFSFLGLMVSVLGFGLSVPPEASDLVPVARATCGILATVSVSTVMFCEEVSGLALTCFEDKALDCRCTIGGGLELGLRDSGLLLPLSPPFSFSWDGIKDLEVDI